MGQHRHEFFEVVVILSGTGLHVTGGFRHRLAAGDVLFLDPRRAHGYEETRSLHLLNILVRDDALARIGRELAGRPGFHALFSVEASPRRGYDRRLRLTPAELEQIGDWAARIEEEASGKGPRQGPRGGRLLQEAYLTLIVDVLSRKAERRPAPGVSRPEAGMGRVLSWIETGLDRPLRVAELAARAGMSVRTFHRVFRAATGRTPWAYIVAARLARAAERLAHGPAETVTETALACGFDDGNYFSRSFRRFAGATPTAYRAEHRGE
jgi:AraC-like DNA-binding protein